MMNYKIALEILKETYRNWQEDDAPELGAALAFYTILSLGPLLLITISVLGLAFGQEAASGKIISEIDGLVGREGAAAIQEVIAHSRRPETNILSSIIGLITLFLGASGVFAQLQKALNTIWQVKPPSDQSFLSMIRRRFFSFTLVIGIGFLLLVSLVITTGLTVVSEYFSYLLPQITSLLLLLHALVSFGGITLLFALLFKVVPDAHIQWKDVWVGALFTAALFTIGKFLIGLYLGQSAFSSTYGAAGSLVALLVWIYYSAQILFFGAELTQIYATRFGSRRICMPISGTLTMESCKLQA